MVQFFKVLAIKSKYTILSEFKSIEIKLKRKETLNWLYWVL